MWRLVYALVGLACVSNSNAASFAKGFRGSLTDSWRGPIGYTQHRTKLESFEQRRDIFFATLEIDILYEYL
jgi:hypothetical protein